MKKKAILMWIIFVACVVATIAARYMADREQVAYEAVSVTVVSAEENRVRNRTTGTTYTSYDVIVKYNGENWELKNAHSAYAYPSGKKITAYLSHGSLYADIAGTRSSTPLFYTYFGFLVGSIVMLCVAISYTIKAKQE